jgi:DNA polymerase I
MSKLVLIDSMAILFRAYHAMPPLTTRIGEPINAVYGMVSMLLRIIQDLKPTHIAFCFDEAQVTFRKKELESYQANRAETPEDLSSQFQKAKDFTKALGTPYYSMPGYEADDVIGTLVEKATDFNETVIVTGDRDILQLVDDSKNIKLYMPVKGLTDAKLFGEAETMERLGVPPKLIPDYKGLVGDPSDNYKGVPGIGPKTAITLLTTYGSFKEIYKNLDGIPEKTREKLSTGAESGKMSYKLAQIVKDVPVKIDFEMMKNWKLDSNQILGLFEEYGFRTLTRRIKEVGKEITSENQGKLF